MANAELRVLVVRGRNGAGEALALEVVVEVECPECEHDRFRLSGHHVRALHQVLTDVIAENPTLCGERGDRIEVAGSQTFASPDSERTNALMGHDAKANPFSRESTVVLPPTALDRLQRPLAVGDQVLLQIPTTEPLVWAVESLTPALDPKLPSNAVRVVLFTKFSMVVRSSTPVREVILVQQAEDRPREVAPPDPEVSHEVEPGRTLLQTLRAKLGLDPG